MLVSIDLSLRSTGVCLFESDGTLIDFWVISPPSKEYNDEPLLNHIANSIIRIVEQHEEYIKAIVIEGLSFNSFSKEKDKINGNFWHLRCKLQERFGSILIGIIPVSSWRSYTLTKEEQKIAKVNKDGLKKACVDKLPEIIKVNFSDYVSTLKLKKEAIYDLCDSYCLGMYRLSLGL